MASITVEIPDDVFAMPLNPPPDLTGWDGTGTPVGVWLRWIDAQPFAPWAATLLDEIDPNSVPEREQPLYLRLLDRMESHAAARKVRAIRALAGPRETARDFHDVDRGAHEVAGALRVSHGEAQTHVYRSRRLPTHLPRTQALFDDGLIGPRHVAKILDSTAHLSIEQCAEVEEQVLEDAEMLSATHFAQRVRRAVARVDSEGFRERHRRKAAETDVVHVPDDDAMSWLNSRLPTVDAHIVMTAVDAYVRERKAAGDKRSAGVLRGEALRVFAEAYLDGRLGHRPTVHGRPVEIHIAATPQALLGITDTPAEIPGVGPIPIETVRGMAHEAKLRWITISDGNGAILDYGAKTWRIPAREHAVADATYVRSVGPQSQVLAERTDGEHLIAWPEGPTAQENIAPMDRPWHRAKTFGGFTVRRLPDGTIEWQSPLGQTIRVHPYDYRLGP